MSQCKCSHTMPTNFKSFDSFDVESFLFDVLGSFSIWSCRILDICYCFLQECALEKIKTNIQNLIPQNQWAIKDINLAMIYVFIIIKSLQISKSSILLCEMAKHQKLGPFAPNIRIPYQIEASDRLHTSKDSNSEIKPPLSWNMVQFIFQP